MVSHIDQPEVVDPVLTNWEGQIEKKKIKEGKTKRLKKKKKE